MVCAGGHEDNEKTRKSNCLCNREEMAMRVDEKEIVSRQEIYGKHSMPHVHCHKEHELYYMVKGSTTYYIGDKIYHIKQGNFVFIPKGVLHKTDYEEHDSNERLLISIGDMIFANGLQSVQEELSNSRVIYVEEERLSYFERLMHQIEMEYQCEDVYNSIMLNLYITELLVQLCRYKQNIKPDLTGMDQLIYSISKYISTHFREQITLEILSMQFSMSASHLSRKFKGGTGIGINEYITYVRVNHAEKLLREEKLTITDVAAQCGYSDSNYFSTVFKRVKGVSPQKYARGHLK